MSTITQDDLHAMQSAPLGGLTVSHWIACMRRDGVDGSIPNPDDLLRAVGEALLARRAQGASAASVPDGYVMVERDVVDVAADMVDSYFVCVSECVTRNDIERWHYMPLIEDVATKLRELTTKPRGQS